MTDTTELIFPYPARIMRPTTRAMDMCKESDMFPNITIEDMRDVSFRNTVDFGKFVLIFSIGATLSNFKNLDSSEDSRHVRFAFLRLLVFTFGLSVFLYHILDVIKIRSKKMVSSVTAKSIIALVQNVQAIWNRAVSQFPCNAVSKFCSSVDGKLTVSVASRSGFPGPTIIWTAFVYSFPEAFFYRLGLSVVSANESFLMTRTRSPFDWLPTTTLAKFWRYPFAGASTMAHYVAQRLAFDVSARVVCFVGYPGFLFTTAHTKATWVRAFLMRTIIVPLMSKNVAKWLSLRPFISFAAVWCEISFLSTSAAAVTVIYFNKIKLELGTIWGMLCHTSSSFQLFVKPGSFPRRLAFSIPFYSPHYNTFTREMEVYERI
jgi:hypothetical protein